MQAEPPKADPPKRKRRWFQFSLRTLFAVVTATAVTCAYVAREAAVVRARQAWAADVRTFVFFEHPREFAHGDHSQSPSLIRHWLGDETRKVVVVGTSDSIAEKQFAATLFPEAAVYEGQPVP